MELTQTEYAALRGVSAAYVSKLKRHGRLVITPAGKVNVEATDRLIESTRDPARGGDRRPQASDGQHTALDAPVSAATAPQRLGRGEFQSYKEAARRERIAKARIAELELAEKTGQLVRREEVESAIFGLARQTMDALDSLADRLASQLAAESDVARVHALLTEHARKIRTTMVNAMPSMREAEQEAA